MERRLFITKSGTLTAGVLALSSFASIASEKQENKTINLVPFTTSNNIQIKGMIVDALTSKPLKASSMKVKLSRNRFLPSLRMVERTQGNYTILSGFSPNGRFSEKIEIEIKAEGYKTYRGQLYLNPRGCSIHSEEWQYNPNFKVEHLPGNSISGDNVFTTFDFRLVK